MKQISKIISGVVRFPIKESIIGDKNYEIWKTLFTAQCGVNVDKSESECLSTKLMSFFVEPSLLDLRASKILGIIYSALS